MTTNNHQPHNDPDHHHYYGQHLYEVSAMIDDREVEIVTLYADDVLEAVTKYTAVPRTVLTQDGNKVRIREAAADLYWRVTEVAA